MPAREEGQLQNGLWLITLQRDLEPQMFWAQGFAHLLFIHARSPGQSELRTHSGRQPEESVETPFNPGKHRQRAFPSIFLQIVFGPQGDGWHGSDIDGTKNKLKR